MTLTVTNVKTFLVDSQNNSNWLFVKIETNEGIYGWGEAYSYRNRGKSVIVHVDNFKQHLIGRSPFNIRHFTQLIYNDYLGRRAGADSFFALAAIEMALWDIVGKYAKVPVYSLLGGACRDKVKVYANAWSQGARTPQEYAAKAVETVSKGFKALKLDLFSSASLRSFMNYDEAKSAIEKIREIRKAVGDDIEIMVEGHRRLSPLYATNLGRMLEEFRIFWYEEPVPVDDLEGLAEVKNNIKIPVVSGETLYYKAAFKSLFEKKACDMINPDISCIGIFELREIATVAETYDLPVTLHNGSSTIALAASVQAATCIPNFIILETIVTSRIHPLTKAITGDVLKVQDGYINAPKVPGLGLDIDEELLKQFPYKEPTQKELKQYNQEGP